MSSHEDFINERTRLERLLTRADNVAIAIRSQLADLLTSCNHPVDQQTQAIEKRDESRDLHQRFVDHIVFSCGLCGKHLRTFRACA